MATAKLTSVRKKKMPKAPAAKGSVKSWDTYAKKKGEVLAHNKKVETELARRAKIRAK